MSKALWITGNLIALLAGVNIGIEHGPTEGMVAWAALAFLVDIRKNTSQQQEAAGREQ